MACFNSKDMALKLVMCMRDERGEINENFERKITSSEK
jgi:hypothetical protein